VKDLQSNTFNLEDELREFYCYIANSLCFTVSPFYLYDHRINSVHIDPELEISLIQLEISPIELGISPIQLQIVSHREDSLCEMSLFTHFIVLRSFNLVVYVKCPPVQYQHQCEKSKLQTIGCRLSKFYVHFVVE
jgi:hypothetical protein